MMNRSRKWYVRCVERAGGWAAKILRKASDPDELATHLVIGMGVETVHWLLGWIGELGKIIGGLS